MVEYTFSEHHHRYSGERSGRKREGYGRNPLGRGQARDEILGMKVMFRRGKVYRFEKNLEDDIGRN